MTDLDIHKLTPDNVNLALNVLSSFDPVPEAFEFDAFQIVCDAARQWALEHDPTEALVDRVAGKLKDRDGLRDVGRLQDSDRERTLLARAILDVITDPLSDV